MTVEHSAEKDAPVRHNHFTRDIKPEGECPRCDHYRALIDSHVTSGGSDA